MKIVFFVFFFAFTFQYSSTVAQNTLTKEQIQFLQVLKSSLEQKEILKFLNKNDFFIDGKIYVTNNQSPMEGLNHTLKLKSGEYVKIQSNADLFFYAIKKHLAVSEYEISENNSRLVLNLSGNFSITSTLEFNKGWNVTGHSISE
ncbi:MAG: hypothetical protein ACR2GN_04565 [Bacteroidia bacterium]